MWTLAVLSVWWFLTASSLRGFLQTSSNQIENLVNKLVFLVETILFVTPLLLIHCLRNVYISDYWGDPWQYVSANVLYIAPLHVWTSLGPRGNNSLLSRTWWSFGSRAVKALLGAVMLNLHSIPVEALSSSIRDSMISLSTLLCVLYKLHVKRGGRGVVLLFYRCPLVNTFFQRPEAGFHYHITHFPKWIVGG